MLRNYAWEQRALSCVGSTYTGLSGKTKEDFGKGDARFVTYLNVFANPITNLDGLGEVEIDDKQNTVKYGDVFFTTSSETPEEVGMSSVWLYSINNVYLNSFCFGFRPSIEADPHYLAFLLRSPSIRTQIQLLAQGISRYNISKTKLMDIEIPTPVIPEQTAIGSFFRTLDTTITLYKRKLDGLKRLKSAYLQQMFPQAGESVPKVRFEGFYKPWGVRLLGEISIKVNEKNKDCRHTETFTNSAEFGIISQRDFFDKDISNEKNLGGYSVVQPNDFVYNPRISNFAPVGPIKRNLLGRTGVMSPLYYVFRVIEGDLTFIEKFFESVYWHEFMKMNGDNGVRADRFNIKDSTFEQMPIPFPDEHEQKAIGKFLYNLDMLVADQQSKLDKVTKLKTAYLSKMFI